MRLDLFLPFLRKTKKGAPPPVDGLLLRTAKRVLLASLFADRVAGKPGLVRKWLKRLGPTWLSAPVRRVSQSLCFALFLVLFFYVCWPYSAQPAKVWPNMQPGSPSENNEIVLAHEVPSVHEWQVGQQLHVSDAAADGQLKYLGRYASPRSNQLS